MMNHPLLKFDEVYYRYPGGETPAINGLSLSVPAGKKSALVGQNGCGKSTLLLLADGLHKLEKGTIAWRGEALTYDRHRLKRWRERIGLAFQDPEQQLVAGTVAEDISYGLCNLKLAPAEIHQRQERAIADFGLQNLGDRPLHHLSLGQKRRVALAGVMALQPKLLLLDEPTAYLDKMQTRHLMTQLDRIHAAGTTIVMATHDLNLAYEWADWMFVLHRGQLVMEGEATDIFDRRDILEQLQLGFPILWEVWQALPPQMRLRYGGPPKTVREWQERMSQLEEWG